MAISAFAPVGRSKGSACAVPDAEALRPARPFGCARLPLLLAAMALLASCAQPDRGACLESHLETQYHPTEVFLGGFGGYTHEYIRSEDPECDRWEYPEGRQGS